MVSQRACCGHGTAVSREAFRGGDYDRTCRGPRRPENRGGADAASSLTLAGFLTALAGLVDAIGYLHLSGLFISFISGNSTQLGAALGEGDLAEAATLIALFVLGPQQAK
jgi:hypothetical protein